MPKMPPKRPTVSPPKKTEKPEVPGGNEFTDSYGIVYLNGVARVSAGCHIRMSRNYQSIEVNGSLQFDTPAHNAEDSIKLAHAKIRDSLKAEIVTASDLLDKLG